MAKTQYGTNETFLWKHSCLILPCVWSQTALRESQCFHDMQQLQIGLCCYRGDVINDFWSWIKPFNRLPCRISSFNSTNLYYFFFYIYQYHSSTACFKILVIIYYAYELINKKQKKLFTFLKDLFILRPFIFRPLHFNNYTTPHCDVVQIICFNCTAINNTNYLFISI